jgi:hypothetical protein
MRYILILAMLWGLLLLHRVSTAETNPECRTRCADEKTSRDISCPPPGDDAYEERAKCLKESQEVYTICLDNCPQPEPADAPTEK